jgi:spermidine/putrescine transport system permease protein
MNKSVCFRRVLIGGTCAWLLLLAVFPYLMLFGVSFLERGTDTLVTPGLSPVNYLNLLSPAVFGMAADSIGLAAIAALLCLAMGYPFAYILAQASPKAQPLLLLLVMLPFWTNSLIRTYALVIMLKADGVIKIASCCGRVWSRNRCN